MVKFRPHREYYNESMRLVKTFNSIDEMKEYLSSITDYYDKDDIVIDKKFIYDKRCGWNTQAVCTIRYGEENYLEKYGSPQCIGHCTIIE